MRDREAANVTLPETRGERMQAEHWPQRVRDLMAALERLGIRDVTLHDDVATRCAVTRHGAHAFARGNHIYLGTTLGSELAPPVERVLCHELIHLAQMRRGEQTSARASRATLELEADQLADESHIDVRAVSPAEPNEHYALVWLLPLAVGAYMMLRPSPANAPGPGDRVQPRVSEAQITGEALALFAVPAGAFALAGRVGLGFYSASAIAGGSATTSLRAVEDLARGEVSGVRVYLFDAATGAVVGVVVPGGVRLVGGAMVRALDGLATIGVRRSDIAVTKTLAELTAKRPLTSAEVTSLLEPTGWTGQAAQWWLERRGQIILYRGQAGATTQILSPIARGDGGVRASEALIARMRAAGITDAEIARYTATFHTQPVPHNFAPPALVLEPLGSAGIPTTRIPGVAANFGDTGVVYVIRVPQGSAIKVPPWGLSAENEWVILHQIPEEFVIDIIPAARIPALTVDGSGRLVPAR